MPIVDFQIFVRNLNGKTVTINVKRTDTVEDLKARVKEKTHIPAHEQRLIYGGKQLEDGKLISDYNIEKESTLFLGKFQRSLC